MLVPYLIRVLMKFAKSEKNILEHNTLFCQSQLQINLFLVLRTSFTPMYLPLIRAHLRQMTDEITRPSPHPLERLQLFFFGGGGA